MTLAFANEAAAVHRTRKLVSAHWDRLAIAVETIFPSKTAWNLAALTGLKVRACFTFLARKSSLSSDALVALLDTPHGPEILKALMGDSQERWWLQFQIMWQQERIEAELAHLRRRKAALDEAMR